MERRSATPLRVFDSPDAIGEQLAPELLEQIARTRHTGKSFLLGLPTGRTPRPIYKAMANRLAETKQDLSHLILVMMDEYLVRSPTGFDYAPSDAPWSCHHFARAEIAQRFNQDLPSGRQIRQSAIWFPDPKDPAAYDEQIRVAGGVDFFLLASGATDGHVAFNPPGSTRNTRTRIIALSESTRRDNLQTFPSFGSLDAVPTHGISVGIETIASAREAAMVVWGESKALTLRRILAAEQYDPSWPATVIHECAGGEIVSDTAAASEGGKP
jgi:glucosamine-6-phosphate deaminase